MTERNAHQELGYLLDREDRLVWVSETWDEFAERNDGASATSARVIGTKLWSHVSEPGLRLLLRQIFLRVRNDGRPIELSCSCDSPTVHRELRVRIAAVDDGSLLVRCVTVAEVPHERPWGFEDPKALVVQCSWCNRIRVDANWLDVLGAVEGLGLLRGPHHPAVSHGLCDDCSRALYGAMEP